MSCLPFGVVAFVAVRPYQSRIVVGTLTMITSVAPESDLVVFACVAFSAQRVTWLSVWSTMMSSCCERSSNIWMVRWFPSLVNAPK